MSSHVPEDLLAAFVEGEVTEQVAVHIATHLDACPLCAARAANVEPLAAAFASMEDPIVPTALADAVLLELAQPVDGFPRTELGVGAGLLIAAAVLVAVWGDPIGLAVQLGVVANVLPNVGSEIARIMSSSGAPLGLAVLTAAMGLGLSVQMAWTERRQAWRMS